MLSTFSPMMENVNKLVKLMDDNRARHKNAWEKVRLDRVGKLLPDLTEDEVKEVVRIATEMDVIYHCQKMVDKIHVVDALKLNDWNYRSDRTFNVTYDAGQ
jgi:hypothetical protein